MLFKQEKYKKKHCVFAVIQIQQFQIKLPSDKRFLLLSYSHWISGAVCSSVRLLTGSDSSCISGLIETIRKNIVDIIFKIL